MRLRLIVPVLLVIAVSVGAFALTRIWSLRDADLVLAAGLALAAVTAVVVVRTERRRRAAREIERYFAFAPDMVIVAGFDGYWKRVNPIVEAVLGYTEAEALSRPFMEFVHPDDRERTEEEARSVIEGATALSFVNRIACKDGSYKWIEWTATPVPEERVMWGIGRDVTDRRRRESEETALRRMATMVAEGLPPSEIFTAVSEEVGRLFDSDLTVVSRFDPEGPANIVVGVATDVTGMPVGSRWELEDGLAAGRVHRTGSSARIDAVDWSDLNTPIGALARGVGVVSTVASPIHVGGRLWGAISVPAREPLPPDAEERLEKFTQLVATAIANADSRQAVARLGDEQAALRRIATLVARGTPTGAVFQAVADEVAALLGCDTSAIVRFDADGAATLLGGHRARRNLGERFLPHHGYVLVAVRESGHVARFDTDDPSAAGMPEPVRSEGIRSGLAAPIVVDGELWGAITVASLEGPLPPGTERRLSDFTDLIATAIANAESRDALARVAHEQAALRRTATLVARGAQPNEVFQAVGDEVGRLFGTGLAAVGRLEPDGRALDFIGADGSHQRVELSDLLASAEVFRTGRSARADASLWESAEGETAERLRSLDIVSTVASPIVVEGEVWGVIAVAGTDEVLPADTEERLEKFTEIVATAIGNAESREARATLTDEQAALRRVATLVARDAPSNEVFESVATEVGKLFDTDITIVGRYDDDGMATAIGNWSASPGGVPVGTRSAIGGRNVLTMVAETGKPARLDAYGDASGEAADIARRHGWRSSIAAPIAVEGRLWGVMLVATQRPDPFPLGAEERLAAFTDLVATAVGNAQSHDEVLRFGDEQAALRRVATLVATGAAPERVFTAVAREVSSLLGLERIEVVRYEGDATGTVVAATGDHPFPAGSRWSLDDPSVMATVARTGRVARIDDYSTLTGEIARAARGAGFQSAIGAPITVEGRLWGVIIAISTDPEPIPERSEARLGQFTDLVATAVANAEARHLLERVAAEQVTLRRIATLVAKGVQPVELFAAVTEEVAATFGAMAAVLRYGDDPPGVTLAGASKEIDVPIGTHWDVGETLAAAEVYRTGRSARVSGEQWSSAGGPIGEIGFRLGIVSMVASPITVEGSLWGVVTVNGREVLPPDTEQRLEKFTELVTTAISNAESQSALGLLADEQATLRRIATLVAEGLQPEEIFAVVIEEVGRLFGTHLTTVGRFEDDPPAFVAVALGNGMQGVEVGTSWALDDPSTAARVFQSGRSVRVTERLRERSPALAEMLARLGVVSTVSSPIMVEGRLWGAVVVSSKQELSADTEGRLDKFTELVATAVANAESRSELAASRRRIVAASDETRRQIERDLHDGTQQRLVSLGLAVRAAEANLPPERDDLRAQLSGVATGLVSAAEDLQEISRGIHPAILSKGGLGPALQALAHRSAIPVDLDVTADMRLAEPIEVAAYFVVSEALANAAKHSEASRIELSLVQHDGSLVLSVCDNGVGGADAARGSGLVGLTDRVEALGGSIDVSSRPGEGTRITAELPLQLEVSQPSG